MERSDGGLIGVVGPVVSRDAEGSQAPAHFRCGFASERDGKDTRRVGGALRDTPGDSMGEYACLSRTGASVNDGGARRTGDRPSLIVVEFGEQRVGIHWWQATTAVLQATRRRLLAPEWRAMCPSRR